MTGFLSELKRRNVAKVALVYIVVGWLLMQIADVMFPALLLPEWATRMLAAFLILGFPVAMIFVWAYEITPEGLKLTADVDPADSITQRTGRKIDFIIIAVLAIAVVLLALRLWTDAPTTAQENIREHSIAVLPFVNRSAAEENAEFFAAGVHDDLLTLLSRMGDLKVISRTSVEQLDPALRLPEIGELLGVATILEGHVQRAGDRLRINVQLIDAASEDHIWANTYDRDLNATNVFEVQSDIAGAIAEALHVELSADDRTRLAAIPTTNTAALERYLMGLQLLRNGSYEALRQAESHFRDATRLDGEFAQAWKSLANIRHNMYSTGMIDSQAYLAVAEPAVERALALDPGLSEAHAQKGSMLWIKGDLHAAERAYKTALELNPDAAESLLKYGQYLRMTGRPAEAIPVLESAVEQDPLAPRVLFELGKAKMHAGNPRAFAALCEQILEIEPSSVYAHSGLLQANIWLGRYDSMWPWLVKTIEADPADVETVAFAGGVSDQLDARDWADRHWERAMVIGPDEPATLKYRIQSLHMRGQMDDAIAIARDALNAELEDRWFSQRTFLRAIRDDALQSGQYEEALALYRENHPELHSSPPEITESNINAAADLALLLREAGNEEQANALINTAFEWHEAHQPADVHGYILNVVDAELLALRGDTESALQRLETAVENGWVFFWQWHLDNENLRSIKDERRFEALRSVLQEKMRSQREAISKLPDLGPHDLRD